MNEAINEMFRLRLVRNQILMRLANQQKPMLDMVTPEDMQYETEVMFIQKNGRNIGTILVTLLTMTDHSLSECGAQVMWACFHVESGKWLTPRIADGSVMFYHKDQAKDFAEVWSRSYGCRLETSIRDESPSTPKSKEQRSVLGDDSPLHES